MNKLKLLIPLLACLALCFFIFGCGNATGEGEAAVESRSLLIYGFQPPVPILPQDHIQIHIEQYKKD